MAKSAQRSVLPLAEPEAGTRIHGRAGWTLLAAGLAFGVTLEALEAFRVSWVVADVWRNRLWALAHFHADAMGLLNLVYRPWARGAAESRALAIGSALIPAGFLFGGFGHAEGDPGLGILLVPVGAVLVISVAARQALRAWRG